MKAFIRLKEVKHPRSEAAIGFRLQAAVPNMEGKAFGREVPLFRGDYLIMESSDHSMEELEREGKFGFNSVVERFTSDLRRHGFTEVEWKKAS